MIKSVTVTNYLGDSIKLELSRPELSGFIVAYLTGLGPGTATINTTELSTTDGSIYNSARVPSRNITLGLIFMEDRSVEYTRHLSYRYFPLKKKVTLLIETDTRKAEISGYVESNDPSIFSQRQATSISIVCPDPYFYSVGKDGLNVTRFNGVDPIFEFPFGNESLTEGTLEMGIIMNETERVINYTGDCETGITISIHAIGEARNVTIHNATTRETMFIDTDKLTTMTGSSIIDGDDIVICTVRGKKSIILTRDGKTINILNCLDKDTAWFQLVKGDNIFAYTAEYGGANLQFKIENRVIYEGV